MGLRRESGMPRSTRACCSSRSSVALFCSAAPCRGSCAQAPRIMLSASSAVASVAQRATRRGCPGLCSLLITDQPPQRHATRKVCRCLIIACYPNRTPLPTPPLHYDTRAGNPRFPSGGGERLVLLEAKEGSGMYPLLDTTQALSCIRNTRKTLQYRLYPNKHQQRLLDRQLESVVGCIITCLPSDGRHGNTGGVAALPRSGQELAGPPGGAARAGWRAVAGVAACRVVRIDRAFQAFFRRV